MAAALTADVSTDGRWCYCVFWVLPSSNAGSVQWGSLKARLLSACPSILIRFYDEPASRHAAAPQVYLLKILCVDRKGLLHGELTPRRSISIASFSSHAGGLTPCVLPLSDVTQVLCELELSIQRVKVSTTPGGRVVDLFFITDSR